MVEPNSSEADSLPTLPEEIKLETAMTELRKLQLEVGDLEQERTLEGRIVRFIPIITALISIAGFITGLLIFVNQQDKDRQARDLESKTRDEERRSREFNDYRTGYEQLLLFSSNDKMTIARVLALKQDLDALNSSMYLNDDQRKDQAKRLMQSICVLISKDFDFNQPRHVAFDIAASQLWLDYQTALAETLGTGETLNESIIHKYLEVIRELEIKESGVFKNAYVGGGEEVVDPQDLLKEPQRSVVNGFACHLNLLAKDKKEKELNQFESYTGAFKLVEVLKENFKCPALPATPTRPATLTN